ncbi:MAG: hypothetical protein JSS13_09110 [Proteobacteria bacterium]|nr:hypothetical protein [Pseudomonadota bacterium]
MLPGFTVTLIDAELLDAAVTVILAVPVWLELLNRKVVTPPVTVFVAVAPEADAPLKLPIVAGDRLAETAVPSGAFAPPGFFTLTVNVVNELVVIDAGDALMEMLKAGLPPNAELLPPPPPPQLARAMLASISTNRLRRAFMSNLRARDFIGLFLRQLFWLPILSCASVISGFH